MHTNTHADSESDFKSPQQTQSCLSPNSSYSSSQDLEGEQIFYVIKVNK
jgi:hypothetical protein